MGWGEVRVSLAEGRVRRGGRAGRRVPLGGAPRVGGSGVGRVPLGSLSRPGALVRIQNSNCPELGRHVGRAVGGWGGGGGGRWGRRITVPSGRRARRGGGLPRRHPRRSASGFLPLRRAAGPEVCGCLEGAAPGTARCAARSPWAAPAARRGAARSLPLLPAGPAVGPRPRYRPAAALPGLFFFLSGSGFPFWSLRWTVLRFLDQARCSFFFSCAFA